MSKCSTSACMYLLLSYMEYHVECLRMFLHAQTNTLCEICTKALSLVWIKDGTSVFSYCVSAFVSQWRTTQALHSTTQGLFSKVNKKPSPPLNVQLPVLSESSMSTLECLTSWDMVKQKPPGTTGGPATAQHLHHVGWMCTHRKEAFLRVPFSISTGKPGPPKILGLLHVPK